MKHKFSKAHKFGICDESNCLKINIHFVRGAQFFSLMNGLIYVKVRYAKSLDITLK